MVEEEEEPSVKIIDLGVRVAGLVEKPHKYESPSEKKEKRIDPRITSSNSIKLLEEEY